MQSSEGQAHTALAPSEVAPPTRVDEAPQQASTSPGDGAEVHTGRSEVPVENPAPTSFKDQVIGYAKVTRGKTLGKHETLEEGQRILDGDASLHKFPVDGEKK